MMLNNESDFKNEFNGIFSNCISISKKVICKSIYIREVFILGWKYIWWKKHYYLIMIS